MSGSDLLPLGHKGFQGFPIEFLQRRITTIYDGLLRGGVPRRDQIVGDGKAGATEHRALSWRKRARARGSESPGGAGALYI